MHHLSYITVRLTEAAIVGYEFGYNLEDQKVIINLGSTIWRLCEYGTSNV